MHPNAPQVSDLPSPVRPRPRPSSAPAATGVRALRVEDLPAVASLFEHMHRSGSRFPNPGLAALFERTQLTSPWFDREIPSLVYELDGAVRGFIGLHVRRIRFDGRLARMAFPAHLMADPDLRGMPAGALLLRRALDGPQDVTLSTAGTEVARMWGALGGRTLGVSSVGWAMVFRPAALLGELALERTGRTGLSRRGRPLPRSSWIASSRSAPWRSRRTSPGAGRPSRTRCAQRSAPRRSR